MMSNKILCTAKCLFWMPSQSCSENVDIVVPKHQMFSMYTQIKSHGCIQLNTSVCKSRYKGKNEY